MDHQRPSTRQEFEIAIICALPLEFDAITLLFDQFWDEDGDPYERAVGDFNHYTTGRFGKYNVVLALLTHTGTATAASAAASMRMSYSGLRLALFVGICSGVPRILNGDTEDEILLGDVVISSTVVQYEAGMQYPDKFIQKNTVENSSIQPNKDIRSLLVTFKTELGLERLQKKTVNFLRKLQAKANTKNRQKYMHPGRIEDKLFESTYRHKHRVLTTCGCSEYDGKFSLICEDAIYCFCQNLGCDEKYLVDRKHLVMKRLLMQVGSEEPTIHVGAVASGNTRIISGEDRDLIAKNEGIIAFEMGGAGVWEEVPCIIVKGVCDYADYHQSKNWQDFAAVTAASASKAILDRYTQPEKPFRTLYRPERDTSLHAFNNSQLKIRQLEIMLARSKGENQILQSNNLYLQTELRFCLQSQLQVPRSITVIDYIIVIDALNRPLRFHPEIIRTKRAFIEILKEAFDGVGSKKLDREDWFLEDKDNDQILDLKREWVSLMRPGRTLHMGMIFRRRDAVSTQCPTCYAENPGDPTEQVTCSCGLTYRRVEEIQEIGLSEGDSQPSQTRPTTVTSERSNSRNIQPTLIPPFARPRPPQRSDNDNDDITRYKRIQVVNTNFQLRQIGGGRTASGHITVSLQDLQDTECLANYLAETYGVPEVDCLVALEEYKPQLQAIANAQWVLAANGINPMPLNPQQMRNFAYTPPAAQQKTIATYSHNLQYHDHGNRMGDGVGGLGNLSSLRIPLGPDGNTLDAFYSPETGGPAGVDSNLGLLDYHRQLKLLEQQNQERLRFARQTTWDSPWTIRSGTSPNPAEQMKHSTPQMNKQGKNK